MLTMKLDKILLIEDNPGDVLLIQEAFEDANLRVNFKIIDNGESAWNKIKSLKKNEFDCILLDINLPRINGLEILDMISQTNLEFDTPIFVLSSSSNPLDVEKALEKGALAYFEKPLDVKRMLSILDKLN